MHAAQRYGGMGIRLTVNSKYGGTKLKGKDSFSLFFLIGHQSSTQIQNQDTRKEHREDANKNANHLIKDQPDSPQFLMSLIRPRPIEGV